MGISRELVGSEGAQDLIGNKTERETLAGPRRVYGTAGCAKWSHSWMRNARENT